MKDVVDVPCIHIFAQIILYRSRRPINYNMKWISPSLLGCVSFQLMSVNFMSGMSLWKGSCKSHVIMNTRLRCIEPVCKLHFLDACFF